MSGRPIRNRFGLLALITGLLTMLAGAAIPAAASAATIGGGATSYTQTFHGAQSFNDVNPCTGTAAHLDEATNSVFHINYSPDGDEFWATFTESDQISGVDLSTGASLSGHGTFWGNYNQNQRNSNTEFTGNIEVRGSDGSRITDHELAVVAVSANGQVTRVNIYSDRLTCDSATSTAAVTLTSSSAKPVYTFTIADLGQGAWGGGALLSDGSISGGGGLADANGTVIATIRGLYWQQTSPDSVLVCFTFNFRKPFTGASEQCLPLPLGGPTKVNLGGDEQTLIRVTPVAAGAMVI